LNVPEGEMAEPGDSGPSPRPARRFRRGIALLPAAITTANMFFGFMAVIRAIHGDYATGAWCIVIAVLLDIADGRIARLTGTASEFGGELDSLADAISFGVAPALLVYQWGMSLLPRIGWLTAFVFVVCGVMRLARFNVQRHVVDKRFFVGLPVPAAAGQIAALVIFLPLPLAERLPSALVTAMTATLALLMVSTLRYPSFKGVDLRRRRSYKNVLVIALLFLLVAAGREWTLLAVGTAYALSAPALHVLGLLRRRGDPPPEPAISGVAGP
jgi:CDP-diacylglycerol--serine O-phosphatidyltransferase